MSPDGAGGSCLSALVRVRGHGRRCGDRHPLDEQVEVGVLPHAVAADLSIKSRAPQVAPLLARVLGLSIAQLLAGAVWQILFWEPARG